MNNKDYFAILQLIRDLLSNMRFYTANIPKDILSNGEWDRIRKDFSEIDYILSKSQGCVSNQIFDDKDEIEVFPTRPEVSE